jgi:hypothetical protein
LGVFGDFADEDREDDDKDDDDDNEDDEDEGGLGSTLTALIEDDSGLGELMVRDEGATAAVSSVVGPNALSEADEEPSSSCCMIASSSCRISASRRSSSASSSPSCTSLQRGRKRLGGGQQPYTGTPQQEPEDREAEAEDGSLLCCSRPWPWPWPVHGAVVAEEEHAGRRREALDCSSPRLLGCRVDSSRPLVLEESILVERLLWASFKYSTVVWPRQHRKMWKQRRLVTKLKLRPNHNRPPTPLTARSRGESVFPPCAQERRATTEAAMLKAALKATTHTKEKNRK